MVILIQKGMTFLYTLFHIWDGMALDAYVKATESDPKSPKSLR